MCFLYLNQDEDVYTFFEPELPSDCSSMMRTKPADGPRLPGDRRSALKLQTSRNQSKPSQAKAQKSSSSTEKRSPCVGSNRPVREKISWNVLDLRGDNYFSCSVGRTRTSARYVLSSSDDVVSFLKKLAFASMSNTNGSCSG